MSATHNADSTNAVSNQTGEFHSSIEGSEPLTTHGHQPGKIVSEKDAAPVFHAETLPAGTAPADRTFKPNNISETPGQDGGKHTSAADTIVGATSSDVHTGLGHPGQGQTSSELHHTGTRSAGLEGTGASGVKAANLVDKRDPNFADQRVIDSDVKEQKDTAGGPAAQDKIGREV